MGLGLPLGGTVGVLVAAQTAEHLRTGYLLFGALVAAAALLLTGWCKDVPRTWPAADRPAVPVRAQLAAFLSSLAHHDFRWAFIGRA